MTGKFDPNARAHSTSGVDGLCGFDSQGRLLFVRYRTPQVQEIVESILPSLTQKDLPLSSAAWLPVSIRTALSRGEPSGKGTERDNRWSLSLTQDNRPGLELTLHRIEGDELGTPSYLLEIDWVAQRHREAQILREQVIQLSRLACIGSLGGPIAHALNNPLATVRGFADLLKRKFSHIDKICYFSEKIINNSERMRVIIEQMRHLSRARNPSESERPVNLNHVIDTTQKVMDEQFKMRNIALECHLDPALSPVVGDVTLWESLFLSLFAISRDSFALLNDNRQRKVTITTRATPEGVELQFSDTAGGFPELPESLAADPMSLLTSESTGFGAQAFVVLEVLRRHDVDFKLRVQKDEKTELSMNLHRVVRTSETPSEQTAA